MKQCVIIIPPLGIDPKMGEKMTQNWLEKYSIKPINWGTIWAESDRDYESRIKLLIDKIDKLDSEGYKISLIGLSVGGSVAINAFVKRKEKINISDIWSKTGDYESILKQAIPNDKPNIVN